MDSFKLSLAHGFGPKSLATFATLLLLSVIIALIIAGIARLTSRDTLKRLFPLLLSLGLFGGIAGYSGGIGPEAAVGQIIPAVLSLAGGLAAYLFGIDKTRGVTASISLTAFTAALFLGYAFGSADRDGIERNAAKREACYRLFYDASLYTSEGALQRANGPLVSCQGFWP
jgi:hypothetical protein